MTHARVLAVALAATLLALPAAAASGHKGGGPPADAGPPAGAGGGSGAGAPNLGPPPAPPAAAPPPPPAQEPPAGARPDDVRKPEAGGKPEPPGKPADAGPPPDAGKGGRPEGIGKPDDVGKPNATGKPEDKGRPDDVGKPNATGKPEDKGRPDEPGRPERKEEKKDPPGRAPRVEPLGPPADVPAVALPAQAAPRAADVVAEKREPAVRVRAGDANVSVAEGRVRVTAVDVAPDASLLILVVHSDGREDVLATNATSVDWNTTGYENGFYQVEVREVSSSGAATVAATRVRVENPRAGAVATVAAVATGTVVNVGAGALASRGVDAWQLLRSSVGELGAEVAEERARKRTERYTRWDKRVVVTSFALVVVAAALVAFFKAYADRSTAFALAMGAIFAYGVAIYAAEWALAGATGARARFRLWGPGALSLVLSALVLRSAFGHPGYVDEDDARSDAKLAGRRAVACIGMGLGLALPFVLVGLSWDWRFAEAGVSVALMMSAAAALPFDPMPGRDVWRWSRPAWAALFGVVVLFHLLWQLAVLPLTLLVAAGAVGLVLFALAAARLRPARVEEGSPGEARSRG